MMMLMMMIIFSFFFFFAQSTSLQHPHPTKKEQMPSRIAIKMALKECLSLGH